MPATKRPAYPPIHIPGSTGPDITREDFLKTSAAMRAILAAVRMIIMGIPDASMKDAYKAIGRALSAEVGKQWSLLTAFQYLTGQRAEKATRYWAEAFEAEGLTRPRIEALIAAANDYCANGHVGKTLSAGLHVQERKGQQLAPEVFLELLDLAPDVIDRVKSHVAMQTHGRPGSSD